MTAVTVFYLSFWHSLRLLSLSNLNILLSANAATYILLLSSECTDSAVTSSIEASSFQTRLFFQFIVLLHLFTQARNGPNKWQMM